MCGLSKKYIGLVWLLLVFITAHTASVSAQLAGLSPMPGRLITPQQRKLPVRWFRKPFGQLRKERMAFELERTQARMTSIRVPANISPFSRMLNFSAYSISSSLGIRRQRALADPDAALRLNTWFFFRRGERQMTQWWESHVRSIIVMGMVFQPRFEGVLSDAAMNSRSMDMGPPVDLLRQNILGGLIKYRL